MILRVGTVFAVVSLAVASAPCALPTPPSDEPLTELVIRGYPPHCRRVSTDLQDAVDLNVASDQQQVVRIDPATGRFALFPDDYPETGPADWQRVGTHIDQFVFRVPSDSTPICIGSRIGSPTGFAQLRRAFAARPYWGKVIRFTGFVATRSVRDVRFWLAAGSGRFRGGRPVRLGSNIVAGGPTPPAIFGNSGWTPLSFTIGPIPCMATQISYGVTLNGPGDVWLHQVALEEVPDGQLSPAVRRRTRGRAYLEEDPICRHFLTGERLSIKSEDRNGVTPLADDNDIAPGAVIFSGGQTFVRVRYEKYFAPGLNN